jgi:MSHA biogenesis protein MshP
MNGRSTAQRGLGAIALILVIVALAAIGAALLRLGMGSQRALADDLMAARALQAAMAGKEWGLYQALHAGASWNSCSAASQTLDLSADYGLRVTVGCNSTVYNEGVADDGVTTKTLRIYTIDAVACNSATSCPDATRAGLPGYVERRVVTQASN